MFVNYCISTVILIAIAAQSIDLEGQPCHHMTKNVTGTCTLLINCDSAFQEVQKQVLPQICGLGATAPIVCCPNLKVGDKARAKCLEYLKLRKGTCDIQFDRSVNFTDAVGKEFPHMAILGYSGSDFKGRKYLCGGALISKRFVLTTAQCAMTYSDYQPKYVRLGDLYLQENQDDAEPQEFKIKKTFLHPGYLHNIAYNNIALVKLNRNVEFTPYVFPTCLHVGREFDASDRLFYAGWGNFKDNLSVVILRRVFTTGYKKCRIQYRNGSVDSNINVNENDDNMLICTECEILYVYTSPGGSLQTLRGDVDCMYDMVGMGAFPYSCGGMQLSSQAFVRISHYIEWIEKIVWP